MIYCGDTVFPFSDLSHFIDLPDNFRNKPKTVNLEALIIEDDSAIKTAQGIALNNDAKVIDFLKDLNVQAVSLSNNHITDFDMTIDTQINILKKNNIEAFGGGDNLEQAKTPFLYEDNGQKFAVISFGWDVIGCKYAAQDKRGVNPMEYKEIVSQIKAVKNEDPFVNIILTFHNNYEFELYPQPAHRAMFFDLIDMGVKAIICHHPHIVGGYETHNNCPIFYSLGNFYLPETNYNGYDLKYPEVAKEGLCVEYDESIENIQLYWTYKDDNNTLTLKKTERLVDSKKMQDLSPFSGMEHTEYIAWFKNNRHKNKLLPIYKNYKSDIEKHVNNIIVRSRQKVIDFLVRSGVK